MTGEDSVSEDVEETMGTVLGGGGVTETAESKSETELETEFEEETGFEIGTEFEDE